MPYQYEKSPEQYLNTQDVSKYPAGMRNNNPGNLKFSGSKWQREHYAGMLGPSVNKDEGSPQIVFTSPEKGAEAMSRLLSIKGKSGLDTVSKLITSPNGWTPNNHGAAANIAKTLGISPHDKIDLNDPDTLARVQRALITQEHGPQGAAYHALVDGAVKSALGSGPTGTAGPIATSPGGDPAAAPAGAPAVPGADGMAGIAAAQAGIRDAQALPTGQVSDADIESIGSGLGAPKPAGPDQLQGLLGDPWLPPLAGTLPRPLQGYAVPQQ